MSGKPASSGVRPSAARVLSLMAAALLSVAAVGPASGQTGEEASAFSPLVRITSESIPGGGELVTVLGRLDPSGANADAASSDVPLVSVLRDTLSDGDRENDRLRYVWVHGYTSPSAMQRIASAVPFLNRRAGNKSISASESLPPSVIDLGAPARELWRTAIWTTAQYALFDPFGVLVKSSVLAFRRNDNDYRQAHVIRALAILAVYEGDPHAPAIFSPEELRDIKARLVLAQRTLGGIVSDGYLQRVRDRETRSTMDVRGHNWELLRQRVEEEGLYFDPLTMPDGSVTHVLVWVARQDIESTREFNRRFLNIKSPWGDKRLMQWSGFTETRAVDADGSIVPPETEGSRHVDLIPLAVYGLDHPKIPALLIDFRDQSNPKRRELSRRLLNDVTRNILSISPYGDLSYLAGRTLYSFVTGRRGMDVNQPSRLRSYTQLKLLLALNETIDPALASETSRLLERVSMNPLQNDLKVEQALAESSYATLVDSASTPSGGLPDKLQQARRQEFHALKHGATAQVLLRTATFATLGLYRHREEEPVTVQLEALDRSRRLTYHERYLKEVIGSTPVVDVTSNMDDVRRSLRYLMEHGAVTDESITRVAARLFAQTVDPGTRELALACLARMETPSAHRTLLAISRDAKETEAWRAAARRHLDLPEVADLARADPTTRASSGGQ